MYSLSRQRVHAFGHADIIFESFPKTKFTMVVPEVEAQLKEMRKRGADTVVLCGIETHVCILATCQDLRAGGLNVSDNSDEQYLISLLEEESLYFVPKLLCCIAVALLTRQVRETTRKTAYKISFTTNFITFHFAFGTVSRFTWWPTRCRAGRRLTGSWPSSAWAASAPSSTPLRASRSHSSATPPTLSSR